MRSASRFLKKTVKNAILFFIIIYQKIIHTLLEVDEYKVCYVPVGHKKTGNTFQVLSLWSKNLKYKHYYLTNEYAVECDNVCFCKLNMKFIYHYSTAKYIIRESEFDSIGLLPRSDSVNIQLWHAAGAFKKMALDLNKRSAFLRIFRKKDMESWSFVLCSSPCLVEIYSNAFLIDKKNIFVSGLPRNDFLFSLSRTGNYSLREKISKGKKVVLYAPTFRDRSTKNDDSLVCAVVEFLSESLPEEFVVAVRLHPSVTKIKIAENILRLNEYHVEECLCLSDYIITDYSSIIFDYALLGRPMLFYVPDLDKYYDKRGFYFEYEEFVPGPIYKNKEELLFGIVNYNMSEWKDKIDAFSSKYNPFFDGKNTERVLNKILSLS